MTLDGLALAIGVSRYRHLARLPDVQDAQDVAAVLADPGSCAYPPAAVTLLLEEEATRAAILGALERLAARATPSSTVFVYFSGHGSHVADREMSCLVPVDGDDSGDDALARTAITGAELTERLRAIPARRLTVALDCCRAAGAAEPRDVRRRLVPGLSSAALDSIGSGTGRAVLAASRGDGLAYVVPGHRNGVFTHHLLAGLRGGAIGVGGVVRVCDLFHYVQERVTAAFPAQRPVFKAELEENYPLALFRGGSGPPPASLPRRVDGFAYDAFVSYRRGDGQDRTWTEKVLVPALESRGLRLCLEHRDFRLGRARIDEIERAVQTSRYTVGVFSPAYLDGAFQGFEEVLANHETIESKVPRFLPVVLRPCALRLRQRMTTMLDLSDPSEVEAGLQRLALALAEPPQPRLG